MLVTPDSSANGLLIGMENLERMDSSPDAFVASPVLNFRTFASPRYSKISKIPHEQVSLYGSLYLWKLPLDLSSPPAVNTSSPLAMIAAPLVRI